MDYIKIIQTRKFDFNKLNLKHYFLFLKEIYEIF